MMHYLIFLIVIVQLKDMCNSFRTGPRALLDVRDWPGGGGDVLLDVDRSTRHLYQLEHRGTKQLPVRERWGGTLSGTVEPGRQGTQVERLSVLLRDVLCVRGGTVTIEQSQWLRQSQVTMSSVPSNCVVSSKWLCRQFQVTVSALTKVIFRC